MVEKLNKELKWIDREINRFEGRIQDALKEIQKDVESKDIDKIIATKYLDKIRLLVLTGRVNIK